MDFKNWVTFLASLLFLEASLPAEACRCIQGHLQQGFCKSTVALLKVKFIKPSKPGPSTSDDNSVINSGYEIQTLQVVKGNAALQDLTFVRTMAGSSCEYNPPEKDLNTELLIAGSISENGVSLNLCSFKAAWSKLSPLQIEGIQGAYQRGCTCEIISCFSQPCSSTSDQCTLDNFDGGDSQNQHQNHICARNMETICSWENMQ